MGKAPLWRRGHRRPQAPESRVDPERPLSSSPLIQGRETGTQTEVTRRGSSDTGGTLYLQMSPGENGGGGGQKPPRPPSLTVRPRARAFPPLW